MNARALICREFDCYYQADELVWEDEAFRELAKETADRFFFYANDGILEVCDLLAQLGSDQDGEFVKRIECDTNVEWSDDANWSRFVHQLEMIIEYINDLRAR